MELIPDSDSGGLVGGDGSITDIILAEYEHQSDSRSFGEVSLLFSFPFVSLMMASAVTTTSTCLWSSGHG